jgi:hypothetical protein
MTATPQDLGIRWPIYLGGYTLALNPATISETPFRAETAERMADGFTVIDRPFILPGSGDVPVDVVQKFVWSFAWPSVNSADYAVFSEMESLPGFFDLCLWKSLVETFSGDGSSLVFRMMRRLANVTLSTAAPAGVTWTPVVKVTGSVIGSGITYGTADAKGTVTATFSGSSPATVPAALASNVRITYTPVFKVRVVSPKRDFSTPFNEARTLTLEEV